MAKLDKKKKNIETTLMENLKSKNAEVDMKKIRVGKESEKCNGFS